MKTKFFATTGFLFTIIAAQLFFLISSCNSKPKNDCKTPDTISYAKDIAPIIEAKCFMCHAPDVYKKKASRNKIFDYKSLKKMGGSGQLMGSITHAQGFIAMPYKKGTKIDACSIDLISKWVSTGMKE